MKRFDRAPARMRFQPSGGDLLALAAAWFATSCVFPEWVAISSLGVGPASAEESTQLSGTWIGDRSGYEVTWRFEADGRMRLEEREATWSVRADTLVVDFSALGESGTERAVYRFLLSGAQQRPRRMFLLGFDLGADGLLLTREEDDARTPSGTAADAADDASEQGANGTSHLGEETEKTAKKTRRRRAP